MPLRDYTCEDHGTFEIFDKSFDPLDEIPCDISGCERLALLEISLPTMRPDKYWMGVMTQGRYISSQKEYEAIHKNLVPATEANKDFVRKQKVVRKAEFAAKSEARRNDFIERTVQECDERPDGSFTNKQLRKIQAMDR